jgi:hypothetical protein
MKKQEETQTYICKMRDGGLKKVTVPAEWNITYGQIVPQTGKKPYGGGQQTAYGLRFYKGAKTTGKCMAVIGGVVEFWPDGISIEEQVVETKRKTYGEDAPEGFRHKTVEARVVSWRSPLACDENVTANLLEHIEEDNDEGIF